MSVTETEKRAFILMAMGWRFDTVTGLRAYEYYRAWSPINELCATDSSWFAIIDKAWHVWEDPGQSMWTGRWEFATAHNALMKVKAPEPLPPDAATRSTTAP